MVKSFHSQKIDVQSLSILWLWTLRPIIMLPLPVPLWCSIYLPKPMFSPPLSVWTLDGSPYWVMPIWNAWSAVSALLFVEPQRYVASRLYPSMPLWITIFHFISLWYPSTCHRELGAAIRYSLLCRLHLLSIRHYCWMINVKCLQLIIHQGWDYFVL